MRFQKKGSVNKVHRAKSRIVVTRLGTGMSEPCGSPVCSNVIEPEGENRWRRTPKKFCSDECKRDAWAIRRVSALLKSLPAEQRLEILFGQNHREASNELNKSVHLKKHEIGNGNQHAINMDNQCEINGENQRAQAGPKERKVYRSSRFPSYTIRNRVRFREGVFETEDVELQKLVESNEWFGVHILRDE